MISQKSLDSITLIMLLLILLIVPTLLTELIVGETVFAGISILMQRVLNILFIVTVILVIIVLVLENEDPVHTLAWILVLFYIPIVGFVLYLFFGRNWRKTRLFNRKGLDDAVHLDEIYQSIVDGQEFQELKGLPGKVSRLLGNNSKAILNWYNEAKLISDTALALDVICEAIEQAERHIHLEYFSISRDSTGARVKDLLIRKAKQGVEVRFIYDDVGCWNLGHKFKSELRRAGVEFLPFMPVWLPILNSHLNYRNHRKLVIVDGNLGFLGGLNIGDKYLGKSKYFGYWRDSVIQLEGDSVAAMQAIFLTDWYFVSKRNLMQENVVGHYFPSLREEHRCTTCLPVQIAASGPDADHASILQFFFTAISNARRSIRITSPYLILNSSLLMALKTAALSGVKVQIILPGRSDHFIVYWGSKSYYRELLETGIEIYEYQSGFMHAKILIVDEEVLSVGTANMDLRSFNQNFEVTALLYSQAASLQAIRQFEVDLTQSKFIELREFMKRSFLTKGLESICRLFSPLL